MVLKPEAFFVEHGAMPKVYCVERQCPLHLAKMTEGCRALQVRTGCAVV